MTHDMGSLQLSHEAVWQICKDVKVREASSGPKGMAVVLQTANWADDRVRRPITRTSF